MEYLQRRLSALLVFFAVIGVPLLVAQDTTPITIQGSALALPVIEALAEASNSETPFAFTQASTAVAIAAFCAGDAPAATITRALTIEEEQACETSGVAFLELLVAHEIAAFVAYPQDEFLSCLSPALINTIFAPASSASVTNWTAVDSTYEDVPLAAAVPAENTVTFALLDNLVRGDNVRSDAQRLDAAAVVAAVNATSGTIGVLDLETAQQNADQVRLVSVDFAAEGQPGNCALPSAGNVEAGLYQAGISVYLYVNGAQAEPILPLLDFINGGDAPPVISAAGFTPATPSAYQTNINIVTGALTGRIFSAAQTEFQVPSELTGEVLIAGSGSLINVIRSASDSLTTASPGLTFNYQMEGGIAGARRLCNGEVDLIVADAPLNDDQLAACEANAITPISFDLGTEAVVMLGNDADDFSLCFTREQIISIWGAPAAGTLTTWEGLSATYPATPMTLFSLSQGSALNDLLLNQPEAAPLPLRDDTEVSADPLYRAAATANVSGALTYMSWSDYQRVLSNNQARIRLVSVDNGSGCVLPSEETIASQDYALQRTTRLIVSQEALADINVQSYLWTIFSNDSYSRLISTGLLGVDFARLPELRRSLQSAFDDAAAALAAAAARAEATPEATAEATPEATPQG